MIPCLVIVVLNFRQCSSFGSSISKVTFNDVDIYGVSMSSNYMKRAF